MSWLTPIDRKGEHPLGWWPRLDGAIGRLPGWRIIVTIAMGDYLFHSGHWLLLVLLVAAVGAVAANEFLPAKPKDSPSGPAIGS